MRRSYRFASVFHCKAKMGFKYDSHLVSFCMQINPIANAQRSSDRKGEIKWEAAFKNYRLRMYRMRSTINSNRSWNIASFERQLQLICMRGKLISISSGPGKIVVN